MSKKIISALIIGIISVTSFIGCSNNKERKIKMKLQQQLTVKISMTILMESGLQI